MPLSKTLAAAGLFCLSLATPALADARPASAGQAFAEPALDETMLAEVHGTGLGSARFFMIASRDDWEALDRLSSQSLSVALDNWFHDIGAPLIATNLTR